MVYVHDEAMTFLGARKKTIKEFIISTKTQAAGLTDKVCMRDCNQLVGACAMTEVGMGHDAIALEIFKRSVYR